MSDHSWLYRYTVHFKNLQENLFTPCHFNIYNTYYLSPNNENLIATSECFQNLLISEVHYYLLHILLTLMHQLHAAGKFTCWFDSYIVYLLLHDELIESMGPWKGEEIWYRYLICRLKFKTRNSNAPIWKHWNVKQLLHLNDKMKIIAFRQQFDGRFSANKFGR